MARSGALVAVEDGNLFLHLHGAAHRSINAIEHHQHGIAPGLNNPAAMLVYRWIN